MNNLINSKETKKNINYHWFRYDLENTDGVSATVDVYQPRPKNSQRSWIVLHPILTGDNVIARIMANYFATVHRWNVAILHRGEYPFEAETPDGFNHRLKLIFEQHKSLSNWLERYYRIDAKKIISIGTSMGGIANATSASRMPYAGYISIVAGADILDILHTSKRKEFKEWRERQRHNYGENYLEEYRDALTYDISDLQDSRKDKIRLLTVIALFDRVVPTKTQRRLKKMYDARSVYIPTGHATGIFTLPFLLPILSLWSIWTFRKARS